MAKAKKLFRTTGKKRKIAGVCGGIAEYMNVDPTIIRLVTVLLALFYGAAILAYIIMWLVVPEQ
jgi:phage shock protein C